jgi:N-acetylglucosamine-6-sulfatase
MVGCYSISYSQCALNAPLITATYISGCQITIKWIPDVLASKYKVKYKIKGQSEWLQNIDAGLSTTFTATGLAGNTEYVFTVTPYCASNEPGSNGKLTVTTASCSRPLDAMVSNIDNTSATISWSLCGISPQSFVRCRVKGTALWTTLPAGEKTYLIVNMLLPSTKYQYQVNSCDTSIKKLWSPIDTFSTLKIPAWQPNVLLIYLDDARYDLFGATGGPSFFHSPAINSIAEEGANFRWCFPAFSLCQPSRASIISGLYPHHHGVFENASIDTFAHITISQIMHDAGYYTGFVGKYGIKKFPEPGYDFYCQANSDEYWDTKYQDNEKKLTTIPGHKTEILTDRALKFLDQVPTGKKFLLLLAHKAPHVPYDPRAQDLGVFDNDTMPFPANFAPYSKNVPSHYPDCDASYFTPDEIPATYKGYFELLNGAEWSVDTILNYLVSKGLLDSTLIIFTSDNGLLIGEHTLGGKEIVLEPSIQLPMFIRYPKWFPPGTIIDDEIAMNIDIAPTILDAAGIPDTFHMDGVSMYKLATGSLHRKQLFYEFFNRHNCNPTFVAVRDFSYKYVRNECSSFSEEFYDLVNDPLETENLINAPNYASQVADYKLKLEALESATDYINIRDTIIDCSLVNPDSSVIIFRLKPPASLIHVSDFYPNPVHNILTINCETNEQAHVQLIISNMIGQIMVEKEAIFSADHFQYQIDVADLPMGTFVISLKSQGRVQSLLFIKQ